MREDKSGPHRVEYERNRKILIKTKTVCGICGQPVDKSLKYPHPLSATADHIVPISKGGHPSDINNLQLAHRQCNREKSDKLFNTPGKSNKKVVIGNRNLPQTFDWFSYRASEQ